MKDIRQKIDSLNALAWGLEMIDPERAIRLSEQAYRLSSQNGFESAPYLKGQANSLFNQAHVNLGIGNYSLALEQSHGALSLFREIGDEEKEAMTLRNIGGVHASINEYSTAMDVLEKALALAERLQTRTVMGEVMLNMGTVYLWIGNPAHALEVYEKVLEIAQETQDQTLQAYVLCNMTAVYAGLSDHENTKKTFESCLAVTRASGNKLIQINVLNEMGDEYLALQEEALAETCFQQGLELAVQYGFKSEEASSRVGVGKILFQKGAYQESQEMFDKALRISEHLNDSTLLMECHHGFAHTCQSLEDFESALGHYKSYSHLKQTLTERINDQKIQTLEVAYRTEAAQKEAGMARIKNAALETEIAERKRMEQALRQSEEQYRRLAAVDPLTGINNRRHFFELAQREVGRSRRYAHPLTAIMVDIDHFKNINDTFGHHRGDMVLKGCTDLIRNCLRDVDIMGRYGGEEFSILLPETSLVDGIKAAKRLVQTFRNTPLAAGEDQAFVTISVGIAELREGMNLDTLIDEADHAMYSAKNAGRNRFVVWSRP